RGGGTSPTRSRRQTPFSRGRGEETSARRRKAQAGKSSKIGRKRRTAPKEIGARATTASQTVAASAHWRRCYLPIDAPRRSIYRRLLGLPRALSLRIAPFLCCLYNSGSVRRCRGNARTTVRHSESGDYSDHSCHFINRRVCCTHLFHDIPE